jgi:putative tryptophan/tyrosine transport system substrate-binding protein
VFTTSRDPVRLGLVTSMSRPDGNVTGASQLNVEVAPKRLELMRELLPDAANLALLVNPTSPIAGSLSHDL